jgi:hypothetical protein
MIKDAQLQEFSTRSRIERLKPVKTQAFLDYRNASSPNHREPDGASLFSHPAIDDRLDLRPCIFNSAESPNVSGLTNPRRGEKQSLKYGREVRHARRRGARNGTRAYKDRNTGVKTGWGKEKWKGASSRTKEGRDRGEKRPRPPWSSPPVTARVCNLPLKSVSSPLHVDKKDTAFNSGWNPLSHSLPAPTLKHRGLDKDLAEG